MAVKTYLVFQERPVNYTQGAFALNGDDFRSLLRYLICKNPENDPDVLWREEATINDASSFGNGVLVEITTYSFWANELRKRLEIKSIEEVRRF